MSYYYDTDYSASGNTNHIQADGSGFCIHHAAGTSINMAGTFLANGTSAHYGVEPGHVRQFLDDADNAWAAGDTWANNHLIHIECVNSAVGGDWPVADGTVDTLVELLADKCREHGYTRLDVGQTLFGHRDFYATYCPGVLYDRLGEIADRVNAILDSGYVPNTPQPQDPQTPPSAAVPDIRYRVCSQAGGWLPEMVNHIDSAGSGDDYAGDGSPITYLAIDMPGWYQVRTEANGWLDAVSRYNPSDLEIGCAGDGSPITGVRCYYETQNPGATGWLVVEYAVANVGGGFFANMRDTYDTGGSGDDFAGDGGVISAFRAQLVQA